MDDDLLLAIRLQEQYNQEAEERTWLPSQEVVEVATVNPPNKDYCIVDPSWELLDPSPDIHALFLQFNQMFFWGKLAGVEVKWSPRMTLCAGVCSYEGRGGLCSIRLSKPLLKFRPRKDLVQTLLHEMIHALLFVTHNNKDRDSHGPEFLKHMNRINGLTGSQISVYHSFHDEVEEYRKHWWRCNGPCQQRKPYYGYVKRAMNRAPSAHDPWWADHQRTCGGTYIKVKEPEPTQKDKKKEKGEKEVPASQTKTVTKESGAVDIRTFMPFSGKGFKLGESSQSLQSKKVQNVIHPSPELPKPVPKNLNNGILNFTSSSASSPHRTENKGANTKMPKISVANTRMFISVGGSPVKVFNGRNGASLGNSSSNSTTMVQKRLSSETFASTNKVQKRIPSETSTSANMVNKRIPSETSTSANMVPKRTPSETFTSTNMVHKRNSSETSSFSKLVQKTSPSKMFTSTNAIQNRIPSDTFSSSNMVQKRTPSETFTSTNMVHKRNSSETSSSSNLVQKTSPSKMFTSSQRSPSASQGANRDGNYGQAAKRPRMDGSQGIKHFFHNVPVVSSSGSKPAIMVPRDQQRPTNVTISSSQIKKVNCPVCNAEVPEASINNHLDSCLSF